MRIRVELHPTGTITVHERGWLGLFESDYEAEYGGGYWLKAHTGKPVSWRVNRAIELAVGR